MAVEIISQTETELNLKITNGDLSALKQIQKQWKFKNLANIILFAIAIMFKSETQSITITTKEKPTALSPAQDLLEEEKDKTS